MRACLSGIEGNFPDFLVVGAGKAGTTSIDKYLRQHADVFLPANKELYFWHLNRNSNQAIVEHFAGRRDLPTNILSYLGLFEEVRAGQLVGEVCPSYLYYHALVIPSLQQWHPRWESLKIVVVLREPVSRMLSSYRFNVLKGLDPDCVGLEEGLAREAERLTANSVLPDLFYRDSCRFCEQIRAFQAVFPSTKVMLYDDLRDRPDEFMRELCAFLGIEWFPSEEQSYRRFNESSEVRQFKGRRSRVLYSRVSAFTSVLPSGLGRLVDKSLHGFLTEPATVPASLVEALRQEFDSEVQCLRDLTGLDLSNWGYPCCGSSGSN
jgi:hypothetical protein